MVDFCQVRAQSQFWQGSQDVVRPRVAHARRIPLRRTRWFTADPQRRHISAAGIAFGIDSESCKVDREPLLGYIHVECAASEREKEASEGVNSQRVECKYGWVV